MIRGQELVAHLMVGTEASLRQGRGELALTSAQAREVLAISETYFRELVARGYLAPVAKLGKGYVFLAADVQALATRRG